MILLAMTSFSFGGNRTRYFARGAICACLIIATAAPTWAISYTWTGAAGNDLWSGLNGSTTNWSPNTLPPTTGDAFFTQITSFAGVDLQTSRTINSITFGGLQNYTLSDGTLSVTSGDITVNAASSATNQTINAPITLGAAGNFTIASPATLTLDQAVNDSTNSYGLTQNGSGTLAFSKTIGTSNLYNLVTTGGTLNIDNSIISVRQINTFAFNFGSTTNVTHGSQLQNAPAGFFLIGGSGTPVLTMDGAGTSATGSTYFVVGENSATGSLILRNQAAVSTQIFIVGDGNNNSVTSTASIQSQATVSTADFVVGDTPGALGSATVTQNGTSVQTTNVLLGGFNTGIFGGTGSLTVSSNAQVTASGVTDFFTAGSTLVVDNAVFSTAQLSSEAVSPLITIHDAAGKSALQITNTDTTTTGNFGGVIANGAGIGSVTKSGAGTQIFSGHNTYTGGTTITGGTLQLAISDALSSTGPVTINGGTLDLGGHDQQIGNFTLTSGTLLGAAGSTLLASGTVKVNAGTISVPTIATGTITKQGTGTVTVTAPLMATTLTTSQGILDAQGGVQANVNVSSGAQLKVRGSVVGTFGALSGGTITLTGGTVVTGSTTVSGTLDVNSQAVFFTAGDNPQVATTSLAGGLISAPDGYTLLGQLSGSGTISSTIASGSGAQANSIAASGGALTIGTFAASDSLSSYTDSISVGSASLNLLSSGQTSLGSAATIAGGSLSSINGILVKTSKTLSGFGTVNGPLQNSGSITGGTGSNVLKFSGAVNGAGSFGGNVEFDGSYSPGNSPAAVSLTGNATLGPVSQLKIELGGTTAGGQYDQVNVSGALTLNGTLDVSLINGFIPAAGNTFDILNWGTLSGTFAALNLPTDGGRIAWNSSQLYTSGVLVVSATYLAGDFNRDGHVNAADLLPMEQALANLSGYEATYGTLTAPQLALLGDINGDNQFNNADVQALLIDFQSGGGSTAPVPEPSSAYLAIAGLACCVVFRTRHRKN